MKTKLIVVALFSLFLYGCNSVESEINVEKSTKVSGGNSSVISPDEAKTIALNFLQSMSETTRSTSNRVNDVLVWRSHKSDYSTRSEVSVSDLSDTLMYIVNLVDDSGYVLVSANRDNATVLAFVEEGKLTPTDTIDNPGFKLFLDGAFSGVSLSSISDKSLEPRELAPKIAFVNKFIKTKWNQRSPFNDQCPIIKGQHALAGCVPIATAQVVAYYKTPSSYNEHVYYWDSIYVENVPFTQIGREGAAHLVHDIGLLENVSYGLTATGAYYEDIATCLSAFNYHYSTLHRYDYETIRTPLSNRRPVIITGRNNQNIGHAWIIDGYFEYTEMKVEHLGDGTPLIFPEKSEYVHCNWGWGGNCNGYFLSGVFNTLDKRFADILFDPVVQGTVNYNFISDFNLYYDIYPN